MKALFILLTASVFTLSAQATKMVKPAQPVGTCIFGEDIGEIEENSRFKLESAVIKTFKVFRTTTGQADVLDKVPMVSVSIIKDLKTKKVYHMNTTFRHIDDGDNTIGWIEEVNDAEDRDSGYENEGRVVADIGDSSIDRCLIRE